MAAILESIKSASFSDVIQWRDPKVSGMCLAGSLVGWYLLCTGSTNLLSTTTRLVDMGLLAGAVHHFGYLDALSESRLLSMEERVSEVARRFIREVFPVLTWENPAFSLASLIMCFVISIVASYLSYANGALILILLIFTAPVAYQKNKDMINEQLEKANEQLGRVMKGSKTSDSKHADPVSSMKEAAEKSRRTMDVKSSNLRYRGDKMLDELSAEIMGKDE